MSIDSLTHLYYLSAQSDPFLSQKCNFRIFSLHFSQSVFFFLFLLDCLFVVYIHLTSLRSSCREHWFRHAHSFFLICLSKLILQLRNHLLCFLELEVGSVKFVLQRCALTCLSLHISLRLSLHLLSFCYLLFCLKLCLVL